MTSKEGTTNVYLGCDGFGEDLKNTIKSHLETQNNGITVKDLGCDTYYDAAAKVSKAILNDAIPHNNDDDNKDDNENSNDTKPNPKTTKSFGVLVCGTGMGVSIIANKFAGIRAATCENITAARCARAVNDANVLCFGQLVIDPENAKTITCEFLSHEFISHPKGADGKPLHWWTKDVENFLSTASDGIQRVEKEASVEKY